MEAATHGYIWALRLGAAAMLVGAIVVAGLFERVAFIPPDKAALEAAEAAAGDLSSNDLGLAPMPSTTAEIA